MKRLSVIILLWLGWSFLSAATAGWYAGKTDENLGFGFHVNSSGNQVDSLRAMFRLYNQYGNYIKDTTISFGNNASILSNSFQYGISTDSVSSDSPTYSTTGYFQQSFLYFNGVFNLVDVGQYSTESFSWSSQLLLNSSYRSTVSGGVDWETDRLGTSYSQSIPSGFAISNATSHSLTYSWDEQSTAYTYQLWFNSINQGLQSGTIKTYSGLNPGTYYCGYVRSRNVWVYSSWSSAVCGYTAPAAPSGFTASAASSQSIHLAWDAATTATSYKVYRSASWSGFYSLVDSTNNLSWTDSSLNPHTYYYYKVSAVSGSGESDLSAVRYDRTMPAAVSDLSAEGIDENSIVLNWVQPLGGYYYRIYQSSSENGPWQYVKQVAYTASTNVETLDENTMYYFRVLSGNSSAEFSDTSDVVSASTAPLPPTTLAGENQDYFTNELSWDTTAGTSAVVIWRRTGVGPFWKIDSVVGETWKDQNVQQGVSYSYTLQSTNGTTRSSRSDTVTLVVDSVFVHSFPLVESFEAADLGSQWTFRSEDGGRILKSTTDNPQSGSAHLALDDTSGTASTAEAIVAVDVSQSSANTDLRFFYKNPDEETHELPGTCNLSCAGDGVLFSYDGLSWYKVQGLTSAEGAGASYTEFFMDLDSLAGNLGLITGDVLYLKFQETASASLPSQGGWLDSVVLAPRYLIDVDLVGNGSTLPAGDVWIPWMKSQSITIQPDADNVIDSVYVNGLYTGTEATVDFDNLIADQTLKVVFKQQQFSITTEVNGNGSINPSEVTASIGDTVVLSVVPDAGMIVDSIYLDGVKLSNQGAVIFADISADHFVQAWFGAEDGSEYTISASAGTGGQIYPAGEFVVSPGANVDFALVPDPGYEILDLEVDNLSQGVINSYSLTNVSADHLIAASFELASYNVSVAAGIGGSVTPGDTILTVEDSVLYFISVDSGYQLQDIVLNGEPQPLTDSVWIRNPDQDQTLQIGFDTASFTIDVAVTGSGASIPAMDTVMVWGETLALVLQPDPGYSLTQLTLDGVDQSLVDTLWIENIRNDHTVTAEFSAITPQVTVQSSGFGFVTPGDTILTWGAQPEFFMTPDSGNYLDSLFWGDSAVAASSSYIPDSVKEDQTLRAVFSRYQYQINTNIPDSGGTITPDPALVYWGDTISLVVQTLEGFQLDSLYVDDVLSSEQDTLIFENVKEDHFVSAWFSPIYFQVSSEIFGPGVVNPGDTLQIRYGETEVLYFAPDQGYVTDSIKVNGSKLQGADSVLLNSITEDQLVQVWFGKQKMPVSIDKSYHGKVKPALDTTVSWNDSLTLFFEPYLGYQTGVVTINGDTVEVTNNMYTIDSVNQPLEVYADFAEITADSGEWRVDFKVHDGTALLYWDIFIVSDLADTVFYEISSLVDDRWGISEIQINEQSVDFAGDSLVLQGIDTTLMIEVVVHDKTTSLNDFAGRDGRFNNDPLYYAAGFEIHGNQLVFVNHTQEQAGQLHIYSSGGQKEFSWNKQPGEFFVDLSQAGLSAGSWWVVWVPQSRGSETQPASKQEAVLWLSH